SYSGLVNGDTPTTFTHGNNVAPTLATVAATSHAGSYAISVSGAADADYVISYAPGKLTITPAALTITADSKTMAYGGTQPALTARANGHIPPASAPAINPAPPLATVPATSPAGTYAITLGGAHDADYVIRYTPGTLTITPAALTITADSKTRVYGAANPAL